MAYIYMTTNLVNGKKYIGQCGKKSTSSLKYLGGGVVFMKALHKYGRSAFKKDIITEGEFSKVMLDELERHYIRLYAADINTGFYNIAPGAGGIRKNKKKYIKPITIYYYDAGGVLINTFMNTTYSEVSRFFNKEENWAAKLCNERKYSPSIDGYLLTDGVFNNVKRKHRVRNVYVTDIHLNILGKYTNCVELSKFMNCSSSSASYCALHGALLKNKFFVFKENHKYCLDFIEAENITTQEKILFPRVNDASNFLKNIYGYTSNKWVEITNSIVNNTPYRNYYFRYIKKEICL